MKNPAPLIELATAYWHSATLIAGVRLDIFSHLEAPQTASALAQAIQADPIATETLLVGLTALELLNKDGDSYQNTALASTFLVKGREGYLGPALLYNGDVYPLWDRLDEVIRTGGVIDTPAQYLGVDDEKTRNFVYGMHHRALSVGRAVLSAINLENRTHLADIGGGPGTYSALLTSNNPKLKAEVLDLPKVVEIAAEIVSNFPGGDRVTCTSFDYEKDNLPGIYDAVLISGVLHREQPDQVKSIFKKVSNACKDDAVIYISDVMMNDERNGPLFSSMFALNMRVLSHGGRCHSVLEQKEWLNEVGFNVTDVKQLPPPINYTIIRAERIK
ncbi:hypothetical protein KKF91_11905 [Myxococcota bacterium]|nr:hypothetical protein [Myxococcota bacterium]MBU1897328.1 hypothetical protein [Myxococcota bacterium]